MQSHYLKAIVTKEAIAYNLQRQQNTSKNKGFRSRYLNSKALVFSFNHYENVKSNSIHMREFGITNIRG